MNELVNESGDLVNDLVNECISKLAALDAADSIINRDTSGNNDVVKAMTAWKEYIKALPSAQPGCEDTVPRTSVEYICQNNTVSTNPYEHKYHDKFIQFMDDPEISDFGRWQHSNGFNTALVAVKCDLDKVPSVTPKRPGWIPCSKEMPPKKGRYLVTEKDAFDNIKVCFRYWNTDCLWSGDQMDKVLAWCEIPEPWEGAQDD